jgi:hypothetical protein
LYRILVRQASAKAAIARCNARADTICGACNGFVTPTPVPACRLAAHPGHSLSFVPRSVLCICPPISKRTARRFSTA